MKKFNFPLALYIPAELGLDGEAVFSVCAGAFEAAQTPAASHVVFEKDISIKPQGCKIKSADSFLTVFYGDGAGAFYALVTLWQIYKTEGSLKIDEIEDAPDILNRGFMLDISRGKVPTLSALKNLADLLAHFKYNQIQLYIEGFSFLYPSFAEYCDESCALTAEELCELDRYCRVRFIDLVPNQNSLGHMAPWLAKKEFAPLAECEGGFTYGNFTVPPTTLDPDDRKSLRLVGAMMDDLLPCFSSKKFHAGLDEPFELGRGKSKDKNLKQLVSKYITELNAMSNSRGKEMMIWADTVHRFGCTDVKLPDNIVFMEWGYEKEYSFGSRCKALADAGKRFYVCPGTSSWLSFLGLTDCMLKNIDNAICAGIENGAEGILLTDWGDGNHMQYMPVSYPAVVYCGMRAWNSQAFISERELANALDALVFEDENRVMGALALDAGKYHLYEEFLLPCRTIAYTVYQNGIDSLEKFDSSLKFTAMLIKIMAAEEVSAAFPLVNMSINTEKTQELLKFLEGIKKRLASARMRCADSVTVAGEFENAVETVMLFTEYRECLARGKSVSYLNERIYAAAERHKKLWLARNKPSGLEASVCQMIKFIK